ncbi:MAG TPA: hypothetical protein VNA19_17545 [Pyrinomonadaceae bacterium]|jgi:hypothetical protein|nr:hypothetical protein [Pyrinomonadaceae bacterium]
MYIEHKGGAVAGAARIGRVTFSKSGKSLYYGGRRFETLAGAGFKANYSDAETGEHFWISGCKKDGTDALYSTTVEIDEDIREEYWTEIRHKPEAKRVKSFRSSGKYGS